MKFLPFGCRGTQTLWSKNYCVDWIAYHGSIVAVGLAVWCIGLFFNLMPLTFVGPALAIGGAVASVFNWLIDRDFSA